MTRGMPLETMPLLPSHGTAVLLRTYWTAGKQKFRLRNPQSFGTLSNLLKARLCHKVSNVTGEIATNVSNGSNHSKIYPFKPFQVVIAATHNGIGKVRKLPRKLPYDMEFF